MPGSTPVINRWDSGALTGGLVLRSETYRTLFLNGLRANGVVPGRVTLVDDPALGAVVLARRAVTPPA